MSTDNSDSPSFIKAQEKGSRMADTRKSSFFDPEVKYGLKEAFENWTQATSAHGVPHIGLQHSPWYSRLLWAIVVLCGMSAFGYQASEVYKKYQSYDKIVSIELVFENVEFPAITVCNLNPFKKSRIRGVAAIENMLNEYSRAVKQSKELEAVRYRRSLEQDHNIPAYSHCLCEGDGIECIHLELSKPESNDSTCLCIFDAMQDTAWPCYRASDWIPFEECPNCEEDGFCDLPAELQLDTLNESLSVPTKPTNTTQCLCHKPQNSKNWRCMKKPEKIYKLWEPTTTTISTPKPTTTTPSPEYIQALGFEGTTDQVALMAKAKENMVYAVASLDMVKRQSLSHRKREFITKCSFNSKECDMSRDFKIHMDPVYGNCFTFNHDTNNNLTASKAGPVYGLRFVAFVNVSEYLPTSDQSGVRVNIHDTTAVPFPDAFGYSAPTGFISSFGVTLKKVDRMGKPFGNCTTEGKDENYIYSNYDYSVEGCQRSCYQQKLLHKCRCGDPRFPLPPGEHYYCTTGNPTARECLNDAIAALGDFQSEQFAHDDRCVCKQPCSQWFYDVGFSAARWPSGPESQAIDCDMMGIADPDKCLSYYQNNAAMIEVYYERHGYELFQESQAYGWVNALADIGGHLGIFTGVSVITVVEFCVLLYHLATICCERRKKLKEAKKQSPRHRRTRSSGSTERFETKRDDIWSQ